MYTHIDPVTLNARGPGAAFNEVGLVCYSVHSSVTAGLMTISMSSNSKVESMTYNVQLQNISLFLLMEHEWNMGYPKFQRLFSSEYAESLVLRQAIITQHALIYTHGISNTEFGAISSPVEFFKLINDGTRLDKPVLFTYVITKNGWYFSETGAAFFKDMLSKHMLHSCAAFSVLYVILVLILLCPRRKLSCTLLAYRYAGEFRVDNHLFGEPRLIIDNDSGTYAPPKAVLPPVKALIETDFPGIAVEALDHEDAGVQQRRKEILALWT